MSRRSRHKLPIGTDLVLLCQNTKFRFLTKFSYPRIFRVINHNSTNDPIVTLNPHNSVGALLNYFDYILLEDYEVIKNIKYLI